jgi:uncharacterized protein YceK
MKRISGIFLAISLSLTVAGCASIGTRVGDEQGLGSLYSGTAAYVAYIKDFDQPHEAGFFIVMGLIFDLPLCLVADTLCIPYDLTNMGRKSETIWYAGSMMYRVTKTDQNGALHGKCSFQFHVQDSNSKYGESTIRGYTYYKHGVAQSAEAWGGPLGEAGIKGEYVDGKPWSGSMLLHASDVNSFDVGPLITYNQGVETEVSNIIVKLEPKGKSPN